MSELMPRSRSRSQSSGRAPAAIAPRLALLAIAVLLVAGCGSSTASSGSGATAGASGPITIAMVDHGPATDPFWVTLQRGALQAAKDFHVKLDYSSSGNPGSPSESTLIEQAVAGHAQGIALTIPDVDAERSAIEDAVHQGTPVVAFNDGIDDWQSVGALDFIGQDPTTAGIEAGQRLASYGFRHVLCVIHEQDNAALVARCQGISQALQAVGGNVVSITVPGTNTALSASLIDQALDQNPTIDSVMALGPPGYAAVQQALTGRTLPTKFPHPVASFDATPDILSGVSTGAALFAINQQPYLQGYYAVQILAQQIRYGLHPYQEIITGPLFISSEAAVNQAGYAAAQEVPIDYDKKLYLTVLSHGLANDPFWRAVEAGAKQAASDFGVVLTYSSPNAAGQPSQTKLINQALAKNPDAMAVTVPNLSAEAALRHFVSTFRPMLVFNAGESSYQSLGALDFIGQDDLQAGRLAGQQLVKDGAHHVLCVIHNAQLTSLRTRCQGISQALQAAGGSVTTLTVDRTSVSEMRTAIDKALSEDGSIDAVMALGPPGFAGAMAALQGSHRAGQVKLATFDTSPAILAAVEDGQAEFAINQQPYLQGFLAVEVLAQQARLGLHPLGTVQTGPSLVTKDNVGEVRALEN
jgi:simple sugar transport system substrate-binding protein